MELISYAPESHLLASLAAQRLTWKDALGEWIDNSLDAEASTIQIALEQNAVSVLDDGHGCAQPQNLFILGSHVKHRSTKLGRYGIGCKDAALFVGGENLSVSVVTVYGVKKLSLKLNMMAVARDGWRGVPPSESTVQPGERGTKIIVTPNTKKIPQGKAWQDLIEELGYLYSPALKSGAQITIKGPGVKSKPQPLLRWSLPQLELDKIDTNVMVRGKSARVYCGIVLEQIPNPRFGLTYTHGFRVIKKSCANGCGTYNISRICGFVELDGSWPLTKNKDDIIEAEELYLAVETALLPLLKRAEQLGHIMQSQAFDSALTQRIQARMGKTTRKAKREPGEQRGTVIPVNTERQHRKAAKEQIGDRFPIKNAGAIRVIHSHLGSENGIGQFKDPTLVLNLDHFWVLKAFQTKNLDTSFSLAAAILAGEWTLADGDQFWLKGMARGGQTPEEFSKALSLILNDAPTEEVLAPELMTA